MKRICLFAAMGLAMASCAAENGSVEIELPKNFSGKEIVVSHITIDNMCSAKRQSDLKISYDTLKVEKGTARMNLDAAPSRYSIQAPAANLKEAEFYAAAGEKLKVKIESFEPLDYEVKGTQLMEDIGRYRSKLDPIQMEYFNLVNSGAQVTEEQVNALMGRYESAVKEFIAANPGSPAVAYALLDLSGVEFPKYYESMTPAARKSIMMPYAEAYAAQVQEMEKERQAQESLQSRIASGTMEAPSFSLPDMAGKRVSLSDFKGKWVVLDFWGSWCGWCIKGFPSLKEAYKNYGDKLVIVGIGCNEKEDAWRAGVKKYELPWVNVYNGYDRALMEAYSIQGFPTKAIVNPEGKLVDLTVGEDPAFFDRLAKFVK